MPSVLRRRAVASLLTVLLLVPATAAADAPVRLDIEQRTGDAGAPPSEPDHASDPHPSGDPEVGIASSSGFRYGLLEGFATGVLAITGLMVSAAARRYGGLDGPVPERRDPQARQ